MNRNPKYLGLIGECLCVVKKKALDICTVPTVKYGRGFVGGRSNNLRRKVWPFYQNRENIEKGGVFENFADHAKILLLQQDNDPKDSSELCQDIIYKSPQPPDFSLIELVWDDLDWKVKSQSLSCARQIWTLLQSKWEKFDEIILNNLIKISKVWGGNQKQRWSLRPT